LGAIPPCRHPSYLFGLNRPHTGSEWAILRAPVARWLARSRSGSVLGAPNGASRGSARSHGRSVTVSVRASLRDSVRTLTGRRACAGACAHGRGRRRVWACVYACVFVLCFTDSNVLGELVNNQTNFHEPTTNPTTIKQSLTESQQQRTTKQSLTDSVNEATPPSADITAHGLTHRGDITETLAGIGKGSKKRGRFFGDIGFLETSKNTIGFAGDITETEKPPPRRARAHSGGSLCC
jgi:hypothetical protein